MSAADAGGNLQVTNNGSRRSKSARPSAPPTNGVPQNGERCDAKGGNDSITIDKSLNVLNKSGVPCRARQRHAATAVRGNDTITVKSGGFVGGVVGAPIVGNFTMFGGTGDDFLDSGFGNDSMFGEGGNDTLRWLPGTLIDSLRRRHAATTPQS